MSSKQRLTSTLRRSAISVAVVGLALLAGGLFHAPPLEAQSPQALEAQLHRLLPLFEIDGVVFTDADERTNRFVVGVENRGLERSVQARLQALGVAQDSVDVVVTAPIVQLETLRDKVRPIEGGLQIRFSNYLCTLGFNAGADFVVNSHCTDGQGSVNGTRYYQPLNQTAEEFIGTEVADPPFTREKCPTSIRGKACRWSDSAKAQRDASIAADQGFIARTDSPGGSLTIAGQFRITSKGSSIVGQTVNKVGRTTGWTSGAVSGTCVHTAVSGTRIVQLCQDWVQSSSVIVQGGDSGSPVFAITSGTDVQLRGILWGGSNDGKTLVFSPIANVERADELGPLATCASGFGC